MALTKVQADGINLGDTFAFTGTVTGTPTGILQVKSTSSSSSSSSDSTAYVNNGVSSLSITPSSSSNKILILFSVAVYTSSGGNSTVTVFRDSTDLAGNSTYGFGYNGANVPNNCTAMLLDNPSTTSSITYQLKHKRLSGAYVYSQINSTTSTFTIMEIASSILT